MNKKLISKCCGDKVMENGGYRCIKCGKPCEVIEEPIQKEEVKTATEMMAKDMQEEEYYRIKHTPSDTFIEDKVKQFDNHFEAILTYWGAAGIRKDLNQFLKSSLQEQGQSILEEIEKKIEFEGYEEGKTEGEQMLSVEDIKQLLK